MIGFLHGLLLEKTPDSVIIDVSGVGYEVALPASSICALSPQGELASLYIHTYVREDAIRLFGFATLFDRKVFELLISVSSVGPKVALALLGPFDGQELCHVVMENNLVGLTSVPGVGGRTAERLALELKPKMQKLIARQGEFASKINLEKKTAARKETTGPAASLFPESFVADSRSAGLKVMDDLRSALQNLGYKDKQISDALAAYEQKWKNGEDIVLEVALREILKKLSGHVFSKA